MPVSISVASHDAKAWTQLKTESDKDFLERSCYNLYQESKQIIQSSFCPSHLQENHITPSKNGLVYAAYHAYSCHHDLTLRPDDIWLAVLSQTGFFVNAHAEELRRFFVSHEGQKKLCVVEVGTIHSATFGELAERMTGEIQKNIVDPHLTTWIMPSFSTTTNNDRALSCGIPSVTLLGERGDWVKIQTRLEKLKDFGTESSQFAELLKPILRYFIETFDNPSSQSVKDFWNNIAHQTGGSGPYHLSGWITAFCFWDETGKNLYKGGAVPPVSLESFEGSAAGCELDGVLYHRVNTKDIPSGYASVPVLVDDNGELYHPKMIAGSIGIHAQPKLGGSTDGASQSLDSIQPLAGWWMIEVESSQEGEKPAKMPIPRDGDENIQSNGVRLRERLLQRSRYATTVA